MTADGGDCGPQRALGLVRGDAPPRCAIRGGIAGAASMRMGMATLELLTGLFFAACFTWTRLSGR